MSYFRAHFPTFVDFLEQEARDDKSDVRFQARNFLLDENVQEERVRTYGKQSKAGFTDPGAWAKGHRRYLGNSVFLRRPTNGPPTTINPQSPHCPETFRAEDNLITYGGAHSGLELLRVMSIISLAGRTQVGIGKLQSAGREIVRAKVENRAPAANLEAFFENVLEDWNSGCDLRPCFATFYADHEDILKERPEDDATGWENEIRDRLGLAHMQPGAAYPEIPILVFRYGIGEVPKMKGPALKPLALPTILDLELSPAFCPAPPNQDAGHTVHLAGSGPLCREIVHPCLEFQSKHLYRVGTIKAPIASDLATARWQHLRTLRNLFQQPDYAALTDPEA